MSKPLVWVIPETRGGIHSYFQALWPFVKEACARAGLPVAEPVVATDGEALNRLPAASLVHVQHEFGLFGSKVPPFYRFPRWLSSVRSKVPGAKVIATAHTVLGPDYRMPWRGRGIQTPVRLAMNALVVPALRPGWMRGTWGSLDGVIVHSKIQAGVVAQSGCAFVREIPHYVPSESGSPREARALSKIPASAPVVMVFGFLTPEKGQDVAIEAMARLVRKDVWLVLAGGVRREADQAYADRCEALLKKHGLHNRAVVSGYVPDEEIGAYYARATLVLAPFRETSGSGSLVQALGRAAPVLASDLILNREINDRQPGTLALFRSEVPGDCAREIMRLLDDSLARESLQSASRSYAQVYSLEATAQAHVDAYLALLGRGTS